MRIPRAVLISDIHFNIQTLELASKALQLAVDTANELKTPLIIAGDLHDTKANIRGECVNAIRKVLKNLHPYCEEIPYESEEPSERNCYILRGNHDSINEKSTEHSLNFLAELAFIVDEPYFYNQLYSVHSKSIHLVPYQHDSNAFRSYVKTVDKGSCIIAHQGIENSYAGDYIQDKSAIQSRDVAGMRVISGHYHTRQTINLPDGGKWDYIGNPFTLNYAEANDPPKGYQVLYSDGSLEFVPTNLRKHIVYDIDLSVEVKHTFSLTHDTEDLVWVKLRGSKEQLALMTKEKISAMLTLKEAFRLDLIPHETSAKLPNKLGGSANQADIMDMCIGLMINVSEEQKVRLKELWRTLKCEL